MLALLPWVAPPLLGALIGFLTNALAIRMLFRPLREVRVLGVRLPLTPGVIPRRRHELSHSIGRMVSEQLLSPESIGARLQSPDVAAALAGQVGELRRSLMQRRLRDLLPSGGGDPAVTDAAAADGTGATTSAPGPQPRIGDLLRPVLGGLLARLIGSRGFMNGVRRAVAGVVSAIGQRRLAEVATPERVADLVAERLLPLLATAEVRQRVTVALRGWSSGSGGSTLGGWREVLSGPGVPEAAGEALREVLPGLTERAFSWLRQPEIRAELASRGRTVVRDVLDKLSLVQKVFVTAGQYDRTLAERMPEIIDDVLEQAEQSASTPEVRERIVAAALAALGGSGPGAPGDDARRGADVEVAADHAGTTDHTVDPATGEQAAIAPGSSDPSGGALAEALVAIAGRLLELLAATPEERVQRWVAGLWDREGGQTLSQLAARYLRVSEGDVADALANRLLTALANPEVQAQISAIVPELLAGGEGSPTLGELLDLDVEDAARVDRWIAARLGDYLSRQIPRLVETLDVQRLVVERIDGLAVEDVERLLLIVIARHLKWINAFGAVIGALIGVVQLLLRFLPAA